MVYAVIDTNVLVSSGLSENDSPPTKVVDMLLNGAITPLFNAFILREYRRALMQPQFGLDESWVFELLEFIEQSGIGVELIDSGCSLSDKEDSPIFDIVESTREYNSVLVTGNIKHFPKVSYVLTPKNLIDHLNSISRT